MGTIYIFLQCSKFLKFHFQKKNNSASHQCHPCSLTVHLTADTDSLLHHHRQNDRRFDHFTSDVSFYLNFIS